LRNHDPSGPTVEKIDETVRRVSVRLPSLTLIDKHARLTTLVATGRIEIDVMYASVSMSDAKPDDTRLNIRVGFVSMTLVRLKSDGFDDPHFYTVPVAHGFLSPDSLALSAPSWSTVTG
jgi:hypothetical protein